MIARTMRRLRGSGAVFYLRNDLLLDVELEEENVAVFDDVLFAFGAE